MYELASQLTKKHGSNVASFHFKQYLMITEHEYFLQLLVDAVDSKSSSFSYNNTRNASMFFKFEITGEDDLEYARSLVTAIKFTNCVNATFLSQNRAKRAVEASWTRSLAVYFDDRRGKSIYSTRNVFAINQHDPNFLKPGAAKIELSADVDGYYCSHFRETDPGANRVLNVSIRNVHVDVEYLEFLVSHFNN
jgi:hypothetical protein